MFEVAPTLHRTSSRSELHKTKTTSCNMWCTKRQPLNTKNRDESAARLSTKQARHDVRSPKEGRRCGTQPMVAPPAAAERRSGAPTSGRQSRLVLVS
ncbi:hypothetical protein KIN20_011338 [Parelaphostrongylus tenuis]|uniref:Uncharacterized protein n=1 Tax=Parelaphostrongylus tenuis TaxID=148309 RepID=A0AAD5MDY8_PARTN|nr:hypothetical protein KIN20_011338 [Parelaphostrongylus tenuis]